MAQMNDNWLVGRPRKRRGHLPIPVEIEIEPDDVEWRGETPVASMTFRKTDEKYLPVYLTANDVEILVQNLWKFTTPKTRRALAIEAIAKSSNSGLIEMLQQALTARQRKPSDG